MGRFAWSTVQDGRNFIALRVLAIQQSEDGFIELNVAVVFEHRASEPVSRGQQVFDRDVDLTAVRNQEAWAQVPPEFVPQLVRDRRVSGDDDCRTVKPEPYRTCRDLLSDTMPALTSAASASLNRFLRRLKAISTRLCFDLSNSGFRATTLSVSGSLARCFAAVERVSAGADNVS